MLGANSPEWLNGAAATDSDAQLRLLLGMQAAWETDAGGVVVADSPSWRAYTGQSVEEWLGYGWLDAVHPDDRAHAERQWREAVAAHRPIDTEFRFRAPNGDWRWTNVRALPVLDGQGRIAKWAGLNIDIDDRKRAEATLRANEERFRSLFERMGHAYVLLDIVRDADGAATNVRILELNPAYGRLMGTSVEAARGHCVYDLFPDVDRWWLETCDRVARAGRPDRVEHTYNDGGSWTCPGKVESSLEVKGELDDEAATVHEGV